MCEKSVEIERTGFRNLSRTASECIVHLKLIHLETKHFAKLNEVYYI